MLMWWSLIDWIIVVVLCVSLILTLVLKDCTNFTFYIILYHYEWSFIHNWANGSPLARVIVAVVKPFIIIIIIKNIAAQNR